MVIISHANSKMEAKTSLLLTSSVVALTVAIMLKMGRPLSYKNAFPKLWGSLHTDETSQQLFDVYSWTHISHGILFYFATAALLKSTPSFPLSLLIAVSLEAIWEIAENSDYIINKYRSQTISLGYFGDSVVNTLGDIMCCMVGVVMGYYLHPAISLGYVAASEIVLGATIKDNVALNVLMLVYPIESVKRWQSN